MERKHKHLEFIQLVITRMNVNSFLIKGWAVTMVAALFAFAAKDSELKYIFITFLSTPMFWLLDGYYLSQERQYRELYNQVRVQLEDAIDYDMNASSFNVGKNRWMSSVFSSTLIIFYGLIVALTVFIIFIIN